jgi:hypothetical protein
VTPCPRPLDPIDAEAVAAGADPVLRADAADHARGCPPCQGLVNGARALREALDGLPPDGEAVPDLAARVTRLRVFSARERRTYAIWNAPILLTLGLAAAGFALLARPFLRATEQLTAGAAALLPVVALGRALARWAADLWALAPTGLEALSQSLRQESLVGAAALGLLTPVLLGLRRILARAPGRR